MADAPAPPDPGEPAAKGFGGFARQVLREAGTARLVATGLLIVAALLVARFSWGIPFANEIERVLFDVRATYAMEQVEEDQRILIVYYDENTLIDTQVRSPLDRAILARALANIDAMEPQAIGVDILIDQATPNDELLRETLSAMETPTYLAMVSMRHNPDWIQPRQEDFMNAFFASIGNDAVRQASVFLQADADNVQRRWPPQPRDIPPLMGNAMAPQFDAYRDHFGSIAYRLPLFADGVVFTKLPIDLFADPEMAAGLAPLVEGRYVLIGTDLQDRDRFETPFLRLAGGNNTIPGVEVHAHLLAQMLAGVMLEPIPIWMLWAAALVVVVCGAATSLTELRLWTLGLLILLQAALLLGIPFLLHDAGIDTQRLPVFGWGLGWVVAFSAVGAAARSVGAEKRQFVTGALGKYLPADVAAQILSDPDRLALHGEKREIEVIFTDLQGFTKLSHEIEPEMVAKLLNRYLDMLSDAVLEHGGTLDKFVGDAVVAFWGAPIDRPDDRERAAQCAVAMWEAGEEFRRTAPEGVPAIGRTRVGLHRGEAIVGNFGGEDRIQYTALGDAMNTAARMESANKYLGTTILATRQAVEEVKSVDFRPLGRVTLSGRATPVEIFEPVSEITRGSSESVYKLYRKFEQGDRGAVDELRTLAEQNPQDIALAMFVERLTQIEPGGSFVLQEK